MVFPHDGACMMSQRPFSWTSSSSITSTSENAPEHDPESTRRPVTIFEPTPHEKRELSRTSREEVQPGSSRPVRDPVAIVVLAVRALGHGRRRLRVLDEGKTGALAQQRPLEELDRARKPLRPRPVVRREQVRPRRSRRPWRRRAHPGRRAALGTPLRKS